MFRFVGRAAYEGCRFARASSSQGLYHTRISRSRQNQQTRFATLTSVGMAGFALGGLGYVMAEEPEAQPDTHAQACEEMIRNLAVDQSEFANKLADERLSKEAKVEIDTHAQVCEEMIRQLAVEQSEYFAKKLAEEQALAKESAQAAEFTRQAEEVIRQEATETYVNEKLTPKEHSPPETNYQEERLRLIQNEAADNEFEVYQKWRKHIDQVIQESLELLQADYDKRVEELEEIHSEKIYRAVFREKESLKKEFQSKYLKAVENAKEKYQRELGKQKLILQKDKARIETEYLEDLAAEKKELIQNLNRVEEAALRSATELRGYINQLQDQRTEKLKEILNTIRDQDRKYDEVSAALRDQEHKLKIGLAAISLGRQINSGSPYSDSLKDLSSFASSDAFLSSVVKSIERTAETGVPTLMDLQLGFAKVADEAFTDSLMGDQINYFSYYKSKVLGHTLVRKRGLVSGTSPEEVLARGEYYLAKGDLANCVKELEDLRGPAVVTLKQWLHAAKDRLSVLVALEAIESHVALSLVGADS